MPPLNFFDMCPEPVVLPVPDNNYQAECNCSGGGGGGLNRVFTEDSDFMTFSGQGTSADPLTATLISGQTIEFEVAVPRINGQRDGDLITLYAPAKPCTLPAGLPGSEVKVTGQDGDILINLAVDDVVVGNILIVAGEPTFTLAQDINLGDGSKFELLAANDAEYSVLGITILGLRTLDYVP